jgi:hypothetical protein
MKNKVLSIMAVVLFMSSSFSTNTVEVESPASCWAAANAAETFVCGSVGCNFELWDAVFNACIEKEAIISAD